jgi:hypothetical protein
MQDLDEIRRQTETIKASGVLGRSRSYSRLLAYLVECTAEGRSPKEVEIATEVFGRGPEFDPGQDSMVRVYAHNLRQKLDNYYADAGRDESRRIIIPRGEYRVMLQVGDGASDDAEAQPPVTPPAPAPNRLRAVTIALAAGLVLAGVVIGLLLAPSGQRPVSVFEEVARSPMWGGMLDDDVPVLVVVGDYYIFAELDERGNVARLVREFDINSPRELDEFMMYEADLDTRYMDLDLTYLPRATASALLDVLRILYTTDKSVQVVSMSELNVSRLRSNHVLYVGYISALDRLMDFVFSASQLSIGDTYDELVHRDSGTVYASSAGMSGVFRNYRDYGLYSTFPGPSGHRVAVVAGTRDTGLMHVAYALTNAGQVRSIEGAAVLADGGDAQAFELLFEVTGVDRTNLDGTLVHAATLDHQPIWTGERIDSRLR